MVVLLKLYLTLMKRLYFICKVIYLKEHLDDIHEQNIHESEYIKYFWER